MKKTGKSISMQPKKSSAQPGSSKEEEYERLMMEMKILVQEKFEEVDSLSDEINKKQKMLQEELRGEVEEKARELSEVQKEFSGYQDKVTPVLVNSKEMDEDHQLRCLVQDLKKSDCESLKVIERLKIGGGVVVVEDKAEMEDDVVLRKQMMFDELLLRARREGDIEMKKLQRLLDALNLVLQSQMSSFEDVFSQKSEMEKVLDITLKESQVMKSKILDLELNSSSSILEKNLKLTKVIEKLIAEKPEMKSPTTFEYSLTGSDNFSVQESSSVKSAEHLNWDEEEEMVHNKDFRTTISTLQKENEELQSKVAEIGKSYEEEALKKAEMMMQRKLDLVIKEKEEEKEMLMNERDLASNKEIEELRKEMNSLVADSSEFQKVHKSEADEILKAFLEMTENLEALHSENAQLRKGTNLAKKLLHNNAVRLKLMDWNTVRLQKELRTRYQEIGKLLKELKSLRVPHEFADELYKSVLQQEVCST